MRFAVPSGNMAIASVSTRGGSAVAEPVERLKSEPKERTKKSDRGAGQNSRRLRFGTGGPTPKKIREIAKTFFYWAPVQKKFAAKFGLGG